MKYLLILILLLSCGCSTMSAMLSGMGKGLSNQKKRTDCVSQVIGGQVYTNCN